MKILMTSWPGSWGNKNPFDSSDQSQIGGAEIQVRCLSKALSAHAEVAYANLGSTPNHCGKVQLFSQKRPREQRQIVPAYRDLLLSAVSRYKPDVVLSYLLYPVSDFVASVLEEIARKDILIGSIVGSWEWKEVARSPDTKCPIPREILGCALDENDFFFTSGSLLELEIKKRSVAPCFDLRPIVHAPAPNVLNKSNTVFSFAQLIPPKRFDLIIETYRKGLEKNILEIDSKLVIAGDGLLRSQYEKMISSYPVSVKKNIKFLGSLSRDEIFKNLVNSRVSMHASDSEGYGTAPIESLLCNVPTVIAGYRAVNSDLQGVPGLFSCAPNVSDMLTALKKAWSCPNFDSRPLGEKYHSDNIGRFAYNIIKKILMD